MVPPHSPFPQSLDNLWKLGFPKKKVSTGKVLMRRGRFGFQNFSNWKALNLQIRRTTIQKHFQKFLGKPKNSILISLLKMKALKYRPDWTFPEIGALELLLP